MMPGTNAFSNTRAIPGRDWQQRPDCAILYAVRGPSRPPEVSMLRRLLALLPCLVLAVGCAKTTTPGPVDSLCTDGTFQCFGNVSAACAAGGKSYNVTQCGTDKFCNATTGKCEATVCEKGSSKCAGSDSSNVCNADGSAVTVKTCLASEKCMAGICVSNSCGGTQQKCGWNAVLTCTAKAWGLQNCKADEMCDPATFACKARACDGSTTQCSDDKATVAICSPTGDAWQTQACSAGQACFDGICHALVNGTTVEDTGSSSTDGDAVSGNDAKDGKTLLELPPKDIQLDAPDLFQCVISEAATAPDGATPMVFSNASAAWLDSLGTLQITGAEGTQKVEIQVAKITEFATGSFTAVGGEAPDSLIGYSDGTGAPGKFQYQAADYTIASCGIILMRTAA